MIVGPPSQHSESDLKIKQWQEKTCRWAFV